MSRRQEAFRNTAITIAVMMTVSAPIWLFLVRLWWEWTYALLTKPWSELLCIGNGCLS